MIKLINILNELQVNNPNIPSKEEAIKLATELVKTHDVDWDEDSITYEVPIDEVNPRLVKFLDNLERDEDDTPDLRFNIINNGENHVIAIYQYSSHEVHFEVM
jgi:hypothetical protein